MIIVMKKAEKICKSLGVSRYYVYPDSINSCCGSYFFLAKLDGVKKLVISGDSGIYAEFDGEECDPEGEKVKVCDLSVKNSLALRKAFPFTNPVSHKGWDITFGLGDRLGLASPGHLRLLKGKKVFPVLAQQSIRELNLTGRTYADVLSAAVWAVFQEGWKEGYGADGDHLKTPEEIRMAIDNGFTMITLDCSEHIDNRIMNMSRDEIDRLYEEQDSGMKRRLEAKYLDREFAFGGGLVIRFSGWEFKKTLLIYLKAIQYTIDVYHSLIRNCGRDIDFEMSIDETLTPTTPESHFFVASELIDAGVEITSLAPRFCGEFQKGIDYRGDIEQFSLEFDTHVKIAEKLGYKISIHSGSDKFSVFPVIGEKTGGKYHVKTAGSNWLEAVRVIAEKRPELYRRMHEFALLNLNEARKYYHISADVSGIPALDSLRDEQLARLMEMDDSRQLLHITYGQILLSKNPDGSFIFRDEIFSVLEEYENEYCDALKRHIGRHLEKLGIKE